MPIIRVIFCYDQFLVEIGSGSIILHFRGQICRTNDIGLAYGSGCLARLNSLPNPCNCIGILVLLRHCVGDQIFDVIGTVADVVSIKHVLFSVSEPFAIIGDCALSEGIFLLQIDWRSCRSDQQVNALLLKRQIFQRRADVDRKNACLIPVIVVANRCNNRRKRRLSGDGILGFVKHVRHWHIRRDKWLGIIPLRRRRRCFLTLFFLFRFFIGLRKRGRCGGCRNQREG